MIRFTSLLLLASLLYSCNGSRKSRLPEDFKYEKIKDSIQHLEPDTAEENTNLLDSTVFIPGGDSVDALLTRLDSTWHNDLEVAGRVDRLFKMWKKEDEYTPEELAAIMENVSVLDTFFRQRYVADSGTCKGKDCMLYAEVVKSTQTL